MEGRFVDSCRPVAGDRRLREEREAVASASRARGLVTFAVLRLPDPMLSRPGPLPSGSAWTYELKWDGFRAIVSTEDGMRVRSRRGWNMTPVLPELRALPAGLVLDGEVAWKGSEPHFPLVCRRVLNRDMSIPLTYVIFDVCDAPAAT